MNTQQLAERQQAALQKNQQRKELIERLRNNNNFLQGKVNEYQASGALTGPEAEALRTELSASNALLEELQNAVLEGDDVGETTSPPVGDPVPPPPAAESPPAPPAAEPPAPPPAEPPATETPATPAPEGSQVPSTAP